MVNLPPTVTICFLAFDEGRILVCTNLPLATLPKLLSSFGRAAWPLVTAPPAHWCPRRRHLVPTPPASGSLAAAIWCPGRPPLCAHAVSLARRCPASSLHPSPWRTSTSPTHRIHLPAMQVSQPFLASPRFLLCKELIYRLRAWICRISKSFYLGMNIERRFDSMSNIQ
jgi:hypothetical protein